MGHGFRLMLQLVATVAAAAAVARATESARRAFLQAALDPPRHRAERGRSIGTAYTNVIELETSGELDDQRSPTDRLLALRHAGAG